MRHSLIRLFPVCVIAVGFIVYDVFLGGSERISLQIFATLLVGIVGSYIAISQLSVNRQLAQNKNTLDFMFKFDTDKYYVDLRTRWAQEYERNQKTQRDFEEILEKLSKKEPVKKTIEYIEICDFMVLLNVIAQSIKAKVFNEEIIIATYDLQLIIYWNGIRPYLLAYRKYRKKENHLCDFEILVNKCRTSYKKDFSHV
jgi:hypothetical protein